MRVSPRQWGPEIGYALAIVVVGMMVYVTWEPANRDAMRLSIWILVAGGLTGWCAGMLMTPNPDETAAFSGIAKLVSSFITGWLVGKMDQVFDPSKVDELFVERLLMFLSAFMLGTLATFVWRKYMPKVPAAN